jgi:hypothetical protein
VQARLLQAAALFRFEPNEAVVDEVLRPVVGGEDVVQGRFGHARRSRDEDRQAVLRWPVAPAVLDLREGFVVRLDLKLERRTAATVLRLPPALELLLDDELRPRARFRLRALGGEGTSTAAVASELPLPVGRWCTLDVGLDGETAWLSLDGQELARGAAEGTPQQEPDGVFEVSPAEAPVNGVVDEVRWFVYAYAQAQPLPSELRPAATYRFAFDARGEPTLAPVVRYLSPEEG